MRNATKTEIAEAKARLLELVKPGDTIYCVLRHVSKSGMMRRISFKLFAEGSNEPYHIDSLVNTLVNGKRFGSGDPEGVKMSGCGMDMGFAAIYDLSRTLFQENFTCIGDRCPSNDHSNGDRNREPHAHSDGGYALRHVWL